MNVFSILYRRVSAACLFACLLSLFQADAFPESSSENTPVRSLHANSEVSSVTATYRCAVEFKQMQTSTRRTGIPHPRDLIPIVLPSDGDAWTLVQRITGRRKGSELLKTVRYTGTGRNSSERSLLRRKEISMVHPVDGKRLQRNGDGGAIFTEIQHEWFPSIPPMEGSDPLITTLTLPQAVSRKTVEKTVGQVKYEYTFVEKVWWSGQDTVNGEECRLLEYKVSAKGGVLLLDQIHVADYRAKGEEPTHRAVSRTEVLGRILLRKRNGIVFRHESEATHFLDIMEISAIEKNPKAKPFSTQKLSVRKRAKILTSYKVEYK